MNNNYAMRSANLNQAGGDAAVFSNGQVAMIIQNSSRVSQFNEAGMNYDVAVVPIPADGQRSASAGGAAWVMSSGSDNKDEAWTFLSWLQSTEGGQYLYTQSGEIFPALQSTARSDAFLQSECAAGQPAGLPDRGRERQGRSLRLLPRVGRVERLHHRPGPRGHLGRRSHARRGCARSVRAGQRLPGRQRLSQIVDQHTHLPGCAQFAELAALPEDDPTADATSPQRSLLGTRYLPGLPF